MIFTYHCTKCGIEMPVDYEGMVCECGGDYRLSSGFPGIHGTRDSFGIGKAFISDKGEEIDTWKKWERAGYSDPMQSSRLPGLVKDKIKDKVDKIKIEKKRKFSVMTGGK